MNELAQSVSAITVRICHMAFLTCDNIERFYLGGAAHGWRRWTTGLGAAPVR